MAIDTSKAFGQSYMEGFRETFDPQQSPFQQTGLDLAKNIERVQLLEKQRQAEMTDMYGRVKMPSGTQMYGNDFAKAKEMTELLTSEATLEKYAESPETQREYAALVNKANQFIAEATAYYKATYGNGDPKTGTYSGSVSRRSIPGYYESQGYQDLRVEDYDDVFENLDGIGYNQGSLRIEGNDFVFDDRMGTSSVSDVNFQNIDVFQPQLEQSRFTSSAEAFSKLPHLKNARSKAQAKEAALKYVMADPMRRRDAYNEYKEMDPKILPFDQAMADEGLRSLIFNSYADSMAANWKPKPPSRTTKAPDKLPTIPPAINGFVDISQDVKPSKKIFLQDLGDVRVRRIGYSPERGYFIETSEYREEGGEPGFALKTAADVSAVAKLLRDVYGGNADEVISQMLEGDARPASSPEEESTQLKPGDKIFGNNQ
tara:strand:- start:425 stop:1711 length:1287 start_codon:yes stop_codon:yes gene_type:complete